MFIPVKPITYYTGLKLPESFYRQQNVCAVARKVIGKLLVTHFNNQLTVGRIVETEAYAGVDDRASHAWNGRFTNRTKIMYEAGGVAYVYLCYGIHHLFNLVTHEKDVPHAVLIRGIEPIEGIDTMLQRLHKQKLDPSVGRGPGNLCKALGIQVAHSGTSLQDHSLFLADDGYKLKSSAILATPRIGVGYAGEDALLPYRFIWKDHPQVSGKK